MRFSYMVSSDDAPELPVAQRVRDHAERAAAAAESGFDLLAVGQRHALGPAVADERGEPISSSQFQPFELISYLAGRLGADIGYLTAVLVSPSLHPARLAEDVATVDALCRGRFHLGLGLGWIPYELEAFGITRAQRVRRFEELVELYSLLANGEPATYAGKHFAVQNMRCAARTRRKPGIPLWIGASVDAAVRRAARLGDAWFASSHTPVAELLRQQALFRAELARLDRPEPSVWPMNRIVCIAEARQSAIDRARPLFEHRYRQRDSVGWFDEAKNWLRAEAVAGRTHWIIGDPDDCARQIRYLRDTLGTNLLNVVMPRTLAQPDRLESIRLFAREVIPALADGELAAADAGRS